MDLRPEQKGFRIELKPFENIARTLLMPKNLSVSSKLEVCLIKHPKNQIKFTPIPYMLYNSKLTDKSTKVVNQD